ncbi:MULTISPECIES: hypothetical protein [Haloferax]|uniref:Uncharacterized protein n=1 Tax=Haloferax marinum TaxID=2666143 RepID=A0A6A8G6W4_9EURY|nr:MULTISPECIES: hypothetical protein [Haloferax]MRW97010.1 hypothetical protein [Haloferax marinum]
MSNEHLEIELGEESGVEEVVLGFRKDGEYYELAVVEPPVKAEIRKR